MSLREEPCEETLTPAHARVHDGSGGPGTPSSARFMARPLEYKWNQTSHAAPIVCIGIPEVLKHEALLGPHLER
jgi:hypothetical protein